MSLNNIKEIHNLSFLLTTPYQYNLNKLMQYLRKQVGFEEKTIIYIKNKNKLINIYNYQDISKRINLSKPKDKYSRNIKQFIKTKEIAERIREKIEKNTKITKTTVSIGLCNIIDLRNQNYENMLSKIDKRLYIAKQTGKNKVIDKD